MIKLKPCPFCDGKAVQSKYKETIWYSGESDVVTFHIIRCDDCEVRFKASDKHMTDEFIKQELADDWNNRTDEDKDVTIKELCKVLIELRELPGEINVDNYDHDDVCYLNEQFCASYHIAVDALKGIKK